MNFFCNLPGFKIILITGLYLFFSSLIKILLGICFENKVSLQVILYYKTKTETILNIESFLQAPDRASRIELILILHLGKFASC